MKKREEVSGDKQPLSLAPLSFEEALADLLQVAPPPKDERPEPEPGREPSKESPRRKRQPKHDKEKGSR